MPGIIIVDNEDAELLKIQNAFFEAGVPCLPIKYQNDPGNISGIDHVEIPKNLQPRIIVLDLNLTESSRLDATSLCGPIAALIKKLIHSGPYMLCIWSKHQKEPEEVITLLEERYKDELTLPLHWVKINKNEFLYGDQEKEAGLKEKIQSLVNENSLLHALLDWEGRMGEAARETANILYVLTKPKSEENTILKHNENLKEILAKIGNETIGLENAKQFPGIAIDQGLAPVLADQLFFISEKLKNNLWKVAVPQIGEKIDISPEKKAKLNSFYHVEAVDVSFPKSCRGVLVGLNKEYILKESNFEKFRKRLGKTIDEIIIEEFFNNEKGGDNKKAERDKAREEIKLAFLEISAECDQAQKKTKLHRYVLAALIPFSYDEYTYFGGKPPKGKAHDGIYRFPIVDYKNSSYILKLSFKYQIGTRPDDNKWLGDPLFRVRDQILSDISFSCAQYSSRPGIIRFD